ncbi:MAG: hypothetical protein V9H69_03235 [Anaerolineae bacterium]
MLRLHAARRRSPWRLVPTAFPDRDITPPCPQAWRARQDGGATWQQVWSETPAGTVAVSSNYHQDETVFASLAAVSPSLNTRLIISHDGGETWSGGGQGLVS